MADLYAQYAELTKDLDELINDINLIIQSIDTENVVSSLLKYNVKLAVIIYQTQVVLYGVESQYATAKQIYTKSYNECYASHKVYDASKKVTINDLTMAAELDTVELKEQCDALNSIYTLIKNKLDCAKYLNKYLNNVVSTLNMLNTIVLEKDKKQKLLESNVVFL